MHVIAAINQANGQISRELLFHNKSKISVWDISTSLHHHLFTKVTVLIFVHIKTTQSTMKIKTCIWIYTNMLIYVNSQLYKCTHYTKNTKILNFEKLIKVLRTPCWWRNLLVCLWRQHCHILKHLWHWCACHPSTVTY